MRDQGDELLATCEPPFCGRAETKAQQLSEPLRNTDRNMGTPAKSVFLIGGAGAVGTASVRGMPALLRLARAGFSIWPFDQPGWPQAVEIYPRVLTGPVVKT